MKLGGFVALFWLGVLLGTPDSSVTSAPGDLRELPHRRDRLVIDGDLADWRGPRLEVTLAEPEDAAPWANRGTFFLCWDASHLWFAARIHDTEVYPAPPTIAGAALYQWDSIELYVDGRGDRGPRMDEDDTQLIVACDGRHGAMQGDELLRSVEDWEVPKRERRGLAVRAAARLAPDGYVVEGAFPLSAVDVAEARAGQVLALDLGWNDWIEDHPRLPELLKDLENLAQLALRRSEAEVAIVDPDSLGWDGLLAWEARAYRAWSWSNGRDFGHPPTWQAVRLVGAPTLAERLTARWGPLPLLGGGFLIALGIALAIDAQLRRRQRRRIRELLVRVEELTGRLGAPDSAPAGEVGTARPEPATADPPPAAEPQPWVDRLADRLAVPPEPGADDHPPDTLGRLLAHARAHMDASLPVGDVADALGVSARTLQRVCQQELGASPREVILAVKMRRARELLADGRWRVGEVAELVGFDSPYHFSRRYKEFHGEPPSATRAAAAGPSATA